MEKALLFWQKFKNVITVTQKEKLLTGLYAQSESLIEVI